MFNIVIIETLLYSQIRVLKTMDITSNQTPFRFPSLKTDEILECLSEVGIEAFSNELMEPHRHKEKVKYIYNELVSTHIEYSMQEIVKDSILSSPVSTCLLKLV